MKNTCFALAMLFAPFNIFSQNVGIGTLSPQARLHITDSSVIFSAEGLPPANPGNPPISGEGRRMMWYADKAAFRSGLVDGTQWDIDNIGKYSFATGVNTIASAPYSAAFGAATTASGYYSSATGLEAIASGEAATAMGEGTEASGPFSTAIGLYTISSENSSTAMGNSSKASGPTATAMGYSTKATGNAATAMGYATTASGYYSTAMGLFTKSKSYAGLVIGMNNDSTGTTEVSVSPTSRLFQIGNGESDNSRSNAMTVLYNGNIGIGTTAPEAKLDINGRTNTNQLQVGPGTVMNNIQSGTHTAGANGTSFLTTTITFPVAFASAPKVIATARNQGGFIVDDTFSVTVRSVSATAVTLNIKRVDVAAMWSQILTIDWIAIQ